jgi:hypothetical protein
MRKYYIEIYVNLAIAILPPLLTFLILKMFNCEGLNEASATPCQFLGFEVGGLVYSLGVMTWVYIGTTPICLFFALVGLIKLIVFKFSQRKNNININVRD